MSIAFALLALRVMLGLIIAAHGSQKLFGWFGGNGLAKTTGFIASKGFKPAWFWTLLGAVGEFGGGVLLALGLLSPVGALGVFASMLMAVLKFHWSNGFWGTKGGYEYPLVLALLAVILLFTGPGAYSIDALLSWSFPTPLLAIGLVLSIVVDLIGLVTSRPKSVSREATA